MPNISSIFLVIALALAVMIGPQTRPWTWGPAMLALTISVAAALPGFWRNNRSNTGFGLVAFGTLVAGWFAWRAWVSPVTELGQADLLLLAGAVGSFISMRAIEGHARAGQILVWGIALLLLANVVVVGIQVGDPSFSPIFRNRTTAFPSGFYAHYNECANFLIATSLFVAAAALFGKPGVATRILWAVIAIAGLVAVYFTGSRGGILGAAVGTGVFAIVAMILGKRSGARWFAPALVAIPLIGLILGGFIFLGWESSQEIRRPGMGEASVMDNDCRLYLLGAAVSSISQHPWSGGGSRSFSWESFGLLKNTIHGELVDTPAEQVHNELVQAATDYGLIGAGLLLGLLGALVIPALVRILFAETAKDETNVWRLGGLAALAGMMVQSSFSFVFHLMPGILLLGICLGQICANPAKPGQALPLGSKGVLSLAAIACVCLLIPFGWKGTRLTQILWPSYFSKQAVPTEDENIDALSEALAIWPQSFLHHQRAFLLQATMTTAPAADARTIAEASLADYRAAERLHPFYPNPVIQRANLLSELKQDAEAEAAYQRAIQLQGGMEPAFRSHFYLAIHLQHKGARQLSASEFPAALISMEEATRQIELAISQSHHQTADLHAPRVPIHESLGLAREANGDDKGALAAYDFTATLYGGSRAHYQAGLLYRKMAVAAWTARRPEEAYGYFLEAKKRLGQAQELPQGITQAKHLANLHHLDSRIELLKKAHIEPLLVPGK